MCFKENFNEMTYIIRGGHFGATSEGRPVCVRCYDIYEHTNYNTGFRVALYIK